MDRWSIHTGISMLCNSEAAFRLYDHLRRE
jgi:hypothetical protein